MIKRVLCGCAFIGMITAAAVAWGQDAAAPKPEAAKDAAPAAAGGGIYGDFNLAMPEEAFGLVAKQAGVELVVNDPTVWTNSEPITLKVDNGYFWPTFLDMCTQAKLRFMGDNTAPGRNRLRMLDANQMPDPFGGAPRSTSEGFVVLVQSANRNYSVSYTQAVAADPASLQIQMQVCVDPATPVTSWSAPVITEAVDENGTSLVPKDERPSLAIVGVNAVNAWLIQRTSVQLASPANIGKKLVSLKGSLRGTAVVKTQNVDLNFPLPAEGTTFKTPNYDIVLVSLAPQGPANSTYALTVRLISHQVDATPRGNARRGTQEQMMLVNSIAIADAKGKPWNTNRASMMMDGPANLVCTLVVSAAKGVGEPAKLNWKLPMETKAIQVPFAFKDLAIP